MDQYMSIGYRHHSKLTIDLDHLFRRPHALTRRRTRLKVRIEEDVIPSFNQNLCYQNLFPCALRLYSFSLQDRSNLLPALHEIDTDEFGILWQSTWDRWWPTTETVDLRPPLRRLRQDLDHVPSGNAICASHDSGQAFVLGAEDGQTMVDTFALHLGDLCGLRAKIRGHCNWSVVKVEFTGLS